MPNEFLTLVKDGMKDCLSTLTGAWDGSRFMGLMQGIIEPTRDFTILDVVKAVFSGYVGEQLIANWGAVSISGEIAVATADPLLWTHDGGPASCSITGYYVVDGTGKLRWIQLFPEPFQIMALSTDVVRVVPAFGLGSRFPSL